MASPMLITTDADFWNAADGSGFFVSKGKVKELPEHPSAITEDALSQGLLREATPEEIRNGEYEMGLEKAVRDGKIKAGLEYKDTVANYERYLEELKLETKLEPDPAPEPKPELKPDPEEKEEDSEVEEIPEPAPPEDPKEDKE
ncbi:unnamed protein product, partial [marine sediment metagenome]